MQTVGRRASLGFAVFALSAGLVGAEGGVQAITARAESRGLERTMLLAPGQSLVPMPLPIVGGDTWSYMKGIAEPPADWATVSFDDASWLLGPSGFGFGDGDDQTVLSEMRYAYSTVYTRRHSDLVSLIGIRHVVLAVNKMDLVDYSHDPFAQIEQDCREFAKRIGLEDVTCIPISGVKGDNIVERSPRTPWYHGSTLMEHLETVEIDENRIQRLPFRMPVQWVSRPNLEFRGFAGTVAAGVIRPGDRIRVQPSGRTSTVSRIVTADGDQWTAGARCRGTETYVQLARPDAQAWGSVEVTLLLDVAVLGGVPPAAIFAGHTHGGQVSLPWLGPAYTATHLGRSYDRGLFRFAGTPLFITAGVGTSVIPIRLRVPPDVALLTLHPGVSSGP